MSKSYLTQSQALTKVGSSGGGLPFVTRSWLETQEKFDNSKLTSYGNNDYVVDDDIVKKTGGGTVTPDPGPTDKWRNCTMMFEGQNKLACSILFECIDGYVDTSISGQRYDLEHDIQFQVQYGARIKVTLENNFNNAYSIQNVFGNVSWLPNSDLGGSNSGIITFDYDDASYIIRLLVG